MDNAYLQKHVGEAVAHACFQLAQLQPSDPIETLAMLLKNESEIHYNRQRQAVIDAALAEERAKEAREAERLRRLREEEESILAQRAVLQRRDQCFAYMEKVRLRNLAHRESATDSESGDLDTHAYRRYCGEDLLKDIADQKPIISTLKQYQDDDATPPVDSLVKVFRGALLLLGYSAEQVETWLQILDILTYDYFFERFNSYDPYARINDARLQRALAAVKETECSSDDFLLSDLGYTATIFNEFIKSGVEHLGHTVSDVLEEKELPPQPSSPPKKRGSQAPASSSNGAAGAAETPEQPPVPGKSVKWLTPSESFFEGADLQDKNERHVIEPLPYLDRVDLEEDAAKNELLLSIDWIEEGDANTDFDASIIMLDKRGVCVDSVYFLQMRSKCFSIEHTGDEEGGGDSNGESFRVSLAGLPSKIHALALISNAGVDGQDFRHLKKTKVALRSSHTSPPIVAESEYKTSHPQGNEMLAALLFRSPLDESKWSILMVGEVVRRDMEIPANFMNAFPMVKSYLHMLKVVQSTNIKSFNPFAMSRGDQIVVPGKALEKPVLVGLGWDSNPGATLDLDCMIAIYSGEENTDYCDFEKTTSVDGAIIHHGDNRTGEGEGDDETVEIDLANVSPSTTTIFVMCTVYKGGRLSDVENVHVRMLAQRDDQMKEICRFAVNDMFHEDSTDTAIILAQLRRRIGSTQDWEFVCIGDTCPGRVITDLVPELAPLLPKPSLETGDTKVFKPDMVASPFIVGVGWDAKGTDLDLAVALFAGKELTGVVDAEHLASADGAITHEGDQKTGEGAGDDERVVIDMSKVSANITTMVFFVTIFGSETLEQVARLLIRAVRPATPPEVMCNYAFPVEEAKRSHCAVLLAKLHREDPQSNWSFTTLGTSAIGRNAKDLNQHLLAALAK